MKLTKREKIAAMCLQGLLSGDLKPGVSNELVAESAVVIADTLIERLALTETKSK